METFADRLRHARELARISARGLDKIAGLTANHVANIESGRRSADVHMSTASQLAAALGVSLDWLVNGEGDAPTEAAIRAAVAHHVQEAS